MAIVLALSLDSVLFMDTEVNEWFIAGVVMVATSSYVYMYMLNSYNSSSGHSPQLVKHEIDEDEHIHTEQKSVLHLNFIKNIWQKWILFLPTSSNTVKSDVTLSSPLSDDLDNRTKSSNTTTATTVGSVSV